MSDLTSPFEQRRAPTADSYVLQTNLPLQSDYIHWDLYAVDREGTITRHVTGRTSKKPETVLREAQKARRRDQLRLIRIGRNITP